MAEIQRKIIKQSGRGTVSRLVHAKADGGAIASWKSDLDRFLRIFNVRLDGIIRILLTIPFQTKLVMNTNITVSDIHRGVSKMIDGGQVRSESVSLIQPIDSMRMLTVA